MRWVQVAALSASFALWACGGAPDAPAPEVVTPDPTRAAAAQLPTLSINTTNGVAVTSKDVYIPATFRLTGASDAPLNEGTLEIKGHGNSTWKMPKKPYRLNLTTNTAFMAMPADQHWVLLANYSDKTLMRNDVTFELSRLLGMAYTPRSRFVDLLFNGAYQGVYQLTEQIRIAPDRVNISEMKVTDTSATTITGGYLIEVDERRGQDFCFTSTVSGMVFCVVNPENLRDPAWARQRQYICDYIRQTEAAIFGKRFAHPQTGYAGFIDVESAINYYLVNEIVKNVDGNLRLSTYLYKKRDGKLGFGPVWDFDLAIGNVDYRYADKTDGWYIRTAPWFARMFEDPAFQSRVKARWTQMTTDRTLDGLFEYILTRWDYLRRAQVKNFQRWPILWTWVWPNRVVTGSYDGEVLAMRDWLTDRVRWIDAQYAR